MDFALLIFGGGLLFWFGVAYWRNAVFGALLLVVFEGAIRKWVLPQSSMTVYFAKDFLLLGAYTGYFFGDRRKRSSGLSERRRRPNGFGEGINMLLLCAVVWTLFESFNFDTGSVLSGLFGWKAYVMYIPLCFMVPTLFRSEHELAKFLRYYLAIALPVALLGVAQFSAGPDSPLNVYASGADSGAGDSGNIAVFGDDTYVRITGTFSYISGYGSYLIVILALLLPLLALSRSIRWRVTFGATLVLVIANAAMTGSRSVALGACLVLAGYIALSMATNASRKRSHIWVNVLAVGAALVAMSLFFEPAVTALQQRAQAGFESGENQNRLRAAISEPLDFFEDAGLFGHGNGIAQPAVAALRKTIHLPPAVYTFASPTDSENSRVLMELGVPGFLLWFSMRVALTVALWRTRSRLRSPFLQALALGACLVLFYQLFTTTTFSPTANVYHWFLAGFILLLPRLEMHPVPGIVANQPQLVRNRWFGRRRSTLKDAAAPSSSSQQITSDAAQTKSRLHPPNERRESRKYRKSSS